MEFEVFVPVPAERLREALADPARVARAVPGLQQEAGAEPIAGRLKVRVGGTSITYRGTVRLTGRDDGSYGVEADAAEARGAGSAKLALTLTLRDADGGTTLVLDGTGAVDGRITELSGDAVRGAFGRLLVRVGERLGEAEVAPPSPVADPGPSPASAPDPVPEEVAVVEAKDPTEPPAAEAAHARRTMIGRSAEEVDHAPPRGRYAPVPAPQTITPSTTLRWAAPAAALALASAIVVTRALRKRR
ncbi:SRPBCC domain-containing protein [Streptomyces sp. NPDC088387]|uniref:SRPBCC domain-containing protein n=1 Tax=Streptomyces sp. NPDC088387 TaxID=3365859 RepID=UPI0038084B2A